MKFTPNFTKREWKNGMIAMGICMLILPIVLGFVLYGPLNEAQINFTAYFIAAGAAVYFLRGFLKRNLGVALHRPILTVYYACLGYLATMAMNILMTMVTVFFADSFVNLNDQAVNTMLLSDTRLIFITVVVLAPIVEECLYRGLLFRGIYDRSAVLAWVISIGAFAASHVVSFIGIYSPVEILLSLVQYLPPSIALALTYQKTGTIIAPMVTHAIINLMAVYATMR